MKKMIIFMAGVAVLTLTMPALGIERQTSQSGTQPGMQKTPATAPKMAVQEISFTCPDTTEVTLKMTTAATGDWQGTAIQRPPITAVFDNCHVNHQDEMVCLYKIGEPCSLPPPVWNVFCRAGVIKRFPGYSCEKISDKSFLCRRKN